MLLDFRPRRRRMTGTGSAASTAKSSRNKRLIFTFTWDNDGPSAGVETLVTITFVEKSGKTVQTLHQRPFLNVERRDSHGGGWTSAFDKLAAYAAQIAKEHSA
ncbi:MAG: SRPBCC domain-containing protein [Hyphomicrobiales bacterium]|nr:SRPBCC domain-containing protein [Hyphomicrobiales bacterium]